MFVLVKQVVADDLIETVNARELHAFLEVNTQFKDWITRRITEYGFTLDVDFCSILSESIGGRPSKEYHITLDMAKELSMVERNAKGKQARQYFIDCERKAIASTPVLDLNNPASLRLALLNYTEKVEVLQAKIIRDAPAVSFAAAISDSDDLILVRDLAKLISRVGVETGEKRLFEWMRANGYILKDNTPSQHSIQLGVLAAVETVFKQGNTKRISITTKVTGKGQKYFVSKFL